jgi:putative hydrolase of the HAD superfamily
LIRGVLLDAAGTLIALREPVGESYSRVAAAHGVAIAPARLADAFRSAFAAAPPPDVPDAAPAEGPARERAWWRSLATNVFPAADPAQRVRDFDACFDAHWRLFASPGAWSPRTGAAVALAGLRACGRRLAVVSNFDRRLPGILEGLGLAAGLDACVLPADAGAAKPDPKIFRSALARLGVAAADAAFVGDDHERDLAPAAALGLHPVDVASLATLRDLPARIDALDAASDGGSDS